MNNSQSIHDGETMYSREVAFLLNGEAKRVIIPPGMTLLEMIHEKLHLYGTKSTCNEGDCGSCTVLIGMKQDENRIVYQAVNSCIYPAVRINNKHLITIEGIGTPEKLHPIQEALLDYHGTQCGYCTPGFVMALLALFINNPNPEEADIIASLEGNLCRCTGYDSIKQAAFHLKEKMKKGVELLPSYITAVEDQIGNLTESAQTVSQPNRELFRTVGYRQPKSVEELIEMLDDFREQSEYAFVNGATDLLVQANVNRKYYPWLIDITEIASFRTIRQEGDKIRIGAAVSLTETAKSPLIREHFPVLVKTISLIASGQIRNVATIAGNIGNASPVADTAPVLLVLDAELELTAREGKRTIKLSEYYLDYKKTALRNREFISGIILPVPEAGAWFQDMTKAAKRRAVDISTVNSAISLRIVEGKISNVKLAFGGVAVYPALAKKAMEFMEGKAPEKEWFAEAAEIAAGEFKPISDVRGREGYRSVLIRNHCLGYLGKVVEKVRG